MYEEYNSMKATDRESITFHGHQDNWKDADLEGSLHANLKNFIAMTQFRVQSGDRLLAEHIQSRRGHHNAL